MKTRIMTVAVNAAGSASGTIATPPGRYAGAYFRCNPANLDPTVTLANMGRELLSEHPATADQFLQELTLDKENLISGDLVLSVAGTSEGGTVTATIFTHYPT